MTRTLPGCTGRDPAPPAELMRMDSPEGCGRPSSAAYFSADRNLVLLHLYLLVIRFARMEYLGSYQAGLRALLVSVSSSAARR
jgi:hypothetical protein